MNHPRISIITPSFNQGHYIEETILSVISQAYPNLEYIIIDGGSTDNTVEVIRKYEKHLAYWVSEPDQGQSHAINKGLVKATGQIFNWLNSDDLMAEGSLQQVAGYFRRGDVRVLCGRCRLFDDATGETKYLDRMELSQAPEETLLRPHINQPSTFFAMPIIRSLGGVNDEIRYVMDLELWARYLLAYGHWGVTMADEVFTHFRLHADSKTVGAAANLRKEFHAFYNALLKACAVPEAVAEATILKYAMMVEHTGPGIQRYLLKRLRPEGLHRVGRYLCKKFVGRLYNGGDLEGARQAVSYYFRHGGSFFDPVMLKMAFKTYMLG